METSAPVPPGAVTAPELAEVALETGPFASIYLTTDAENDHAAQRSELRWKDLRRQLADEGTPPEVLDAVDPLVPDAHLYGQCLSVIAWPGAPPHVEYQLEPPVADLGRWSAAPVLAPLIEWRQQSVPHVIVLADRQGADLVAVQRDRSEATVEVGTDHDARKVAAGGWSQRRHQQRAENAWHHHAEAVADQVGALAGRIGARLVVLAGDPRALEMVEANLPKDLEGTVRRVSGGRASGSSLDTVADEATRLASQVSAADTRRLLEKLRQQEGEGVRAAHRTEEVLAALNEARVEVLFVPGDAAKGPTAFFGDAAVPVATSASVLEGLDAGRHKEAPLIDVAIRAALGTDAGIRVVPAWGPDDELAALLRW
jgi:hypothetical protein